MTNQKHRTAAAQWAKGVLADPAAIILDTETTGLNYQARMVQFAAIDTGGNTLLDTLINPGISIPADATRIHGITNADVYSAPTLPVILPAINQILTRASRVIVYNADYDRRIIWQHVAAYVPGVANRLDSLYWECAMYQYAGFVGEWDEYHGNYRWQKLPAAPGVQAHNALGDCLSTLAIIREMAAAE